MGPIIKDQWKDWTKLPTGQCAGYFREYGKYKVVSRMGYFYLYDGSNYLGIYDTMKEVLDLIK